MKINLIYLLIICLKLTNCLEIYRVNPTSLINAEVLVDGTNYLVNQHFEHVHHTYLTDEAFTLFRILVNDREQLVAEMLDVHVNAGNSTETHLPLDIVVQRSIDPKAPNETMLHIAYTCHEPWLMEVRASVTITVKDDHPETVPFAWTYRCMNAPRTDFHVTFGDYRYVKAPKVVVDGAVVPQWARNAPPENRVEVGDHVDLGELWFYVQDRRFPSPDRLTYIPLEVQLRMGDQDGIFTILDCTDDFPCVLQKGHRLTSKTALQLDIEYECRQHVDRNFYMEMELTLHAPFEPLVLGWWKRCKTTKRFTADDALHLSRIFWSMWSAEKPYSDYFESIAVWNISEVQRTQEVTLHEFDRPDDYCLMVRLHFTPTKMTSDALPTMFRGIRVFYLADVICLVDEIPCEDGMTIAYRVPPECKYEACPPTPRSAIAFRWMVILLSVLCVLLGILTFVSYRRDALCFAVRKVEKV